eukprot:CAMPEP_0202496920 /NCGR_PEP_ID=MMETSP1361-20130828/21371_1 /ASSEMBLY_ACC=CAM_ASM_000849 /TAXON_ID=210615 /ORGANISM="Staurosira complex sp., Strain CCMP2646" /LENGTH=43 /DNA_ID= /DNA_START= /DNA_END= /DNA_ORIENTATION=
MGESILRRLDECRRWDDEGFKRLARQPRMPLRRRRTGGDESKL